MGKKVILKSVLVWFLCLLFTCLFSSKTSASSYDEVLKKFDDVLYYDKDIQKAKSMILSGEVKVSMKNKEGKNPLYIACSNYSSFCKNGTCSEDYKSFIKFLVESGSDVNPVIIYSDGSKGYPLLYWVIHSGDLDLIKYLISKGAKLDDRALKGLAYAAERGYLHVLRYFADVHKINLANYPSVLFHAVGGGHYDVVRYLFDNFDFDVNYGNCDGFGYTPLYAAVKGIYIKAVQERALLLTDEPTCNAGYQECLKVVEFLLKKGADPNVFYPATFKEDIGTAYDIAKRIPNFYWSEKVLSLLHKYKPYVKRDFSDIFYYVKSGNIEKINRLLECGVLEVNSSIGGIREGKTLLRALIDYLVNDSCISKDKCLSLLEFLLKKGSDISAYSCYIGLGLDSCYFIYPPLIAEIKDEKVRKEVMKLAKKYARYKFWIFRFYKNYMPHRNDFYRKYENGVVEMDYGSFTIKYPSSNPEMFTIKSDSLASLNSQIRTFASGRGISISSGFDLTPALIKWIIQKTPSIVWKGWKLPKDEKESYPLKVGIVTSTLHNLILNADFKLLNEMISDFVVEKFGSS